jgi:hypothetical protein
VYAGIGIKQVADDPIQDTSLTVDKEVSVMSLPVPTATRLVRKGITVSLHDGFSDG